MALDFGVDTDLDTERYKSSLPALPTAPEPGGGLPALSTGRPSSPAPNPLGAGQVSATEQYRRVLGAPIALPTEPRPTGNPITDTLEKVSEATGGILLPRIAAERRQRLHLEQQRTIAERKMQIDVLKAYSELDRQALDVVTGTLTAMDKFLKENPDASPQDRATVVNELTTLAGRAGAPQDSMRTMLSITANSPTLAEVAAWAVPYIDDPRAFGTSVLTSTSMIGKGEPPEKVRSRLMSMIAVPVLQDAPNFARGAMRAEKQRSGDKATLTVLDLASQAEETLGPRGQVLGAFFRGAMPELEKQRAEMLASLEPLGVRNPATMEAEAKERATTRARTEAGPVDVKDPINQKLVAAGIDPRKADPSDPNYAAAVKLAGELVKREGVQQAGAESQARAQGALDVETSTQAIAGAASRAGAVAAAQAPYQIAVSAAQGREAAQRPEKADPPERLRLTEDAATLAQLGRLSLLYQPRFVGPIAGRVGTAKETTGAISTEEAEFRAGVATLRNQVIKQITGAQMSEPEAKRIMNQIPDLTNPPTVFEARLKQTTENLRNLAETRRKTMGETGVDIRGLSPLPGSPGAADADARAKGKFLKK